MSPRTKNGRIIALEINDILWLDEVVDKIQQKHKVTTDEVEEVFCNEPRYRRAQKGRYKGEDLYYAYGQTDSGRFMLVVFIYKKGHEALITSARDMDYRERRGYGKK